MNLDEASLLRELHAVTYEVQKDLENSSFVAKNSSEDEGLALVYNQYQP